MDNKQITIETFNRAAEKYWQYFKDFILYQPTYDWFLAQLPQEPIEILEIACGPGNVSRYLLTHKPNIKLFGIDLAPKMIELASKHNPQANYQVMDCRIISTIESTFDAVMCGFCIPYLSWIECELLIKAMVSKLKTGGILYLSTTKGEKANEGIQASKSAAGAVYVHYHDINAIQLCLKNAGMTVSTLEELNHIHNDQAITDVFILAQKTG